jgi:hypothetical protein
LSNWKSKTVWSKRKISTPYKKVLETRRTLWFGMIGKIKTSGERAVSADFASSNSSEPFNLSSALVNDSRFDQMANQTV